MPARAFQPPYAPRSEKRANPKPAAIIPPANFNDNITHTSERALDTCNPPRHIAAMTVAITKDVGDFLQEQIQAGNWSDASNLNIHFLRSARNQPR